MFLDEAIIDVTGGEGGRGAVSWRREKYIAKGGPDGGDGGRGGNVILIADENADTLSSFTSRKRFEAEKGRYGSGSNKAGKDGEDMTLKVPTGTTIVQLDDARNPIGVLADLREHGDRIIVAFGGRGGFGNAHFVSSTRQRPDFAELGEPGEHKFLKLELKLIADVGIIGYPSVGKSTLISVISNAKPKIGDYPFTTLIPNLGVVHVHDRSFIVCDVPGLIEGASEGKGLGDTFLRHIERCGVLLHLLDVSRAFNAEGGISADALVTDYRAIRHELEAYSPTLSAKRELVILNKIDLIPETHAELEDTLRKAGIPVLMGISAATKLHTQNLLERVLPIVLEEREKRDVHTEPEDGETQELPILRPQEESNRMGAYRLEQKQNGDIVIRGKRLEQFTKMTNFDSAGGVQRFRDVLDRVGVLKAIKHCHPTDETPVFIGDIRVDGYL